MRVNEDGREVNWRWIGDERRKMIGIREKIRKGIKGNYNVNAIYFMGWKGTWKEIWVTESVSREDE